MTAVTIFIYLTFQSPNLMWRNDPSNDWQIMEETSMTALASAGDTVIWKIDDDTIKKIKNITMGKKDKLPQGYQWKDIWSKKPKKDSKMQYSGIISTEMRKGDADGYNISVQVKNGDDITIDPGVGIEYPPN